jgi:hypothetical protein
MALQKADILKEFHQRLRGPVDRIAAERSTREEKARRVNALVNAIKASAVATCRSAVNWESVPMPMAYFRAYRVAGKQPMP